MTNLIKVVSYDYESRTLVVHEVEQRDTKAFLALAHKVTGADTVERAALLGGMLHAWIDENGLRDKADQWSAIAEYPDPILGNVLFTGGDTKDGYSKGVPMFLLRDDCAGLHSLIAQV